MEPSGKTGERGHNSLYEKVKVRTVREEEKDKVGKRKSSTWRTKPDPKLPTTLQPF